MKLFVKPILVAAILALSGVEVSSTELAILKNGSTICHERHEPRGGMTRLYTMDPADGSESYVEIPTAEILSFEVLQTPAARRVVATSVPAPTPPSESPLNGVEDSQSLAEVIQAAGIRNGIDPILIASIIRAESGFHSTAVSPKGAQGLMQLMPSTAARMGVDNPFNPAANVDGGTRYLVELLARYNDNLIDALAAYNAGPNRVEQYHGIPPYRETRAYVKRVITDFNRSKLAQRRAQSASKKSSAVLPNSQKSASTTSQP
jgi:soluble lytic murein transglycosylase-like protein